MYGPTEEEAKETSLNIIHLPRRMIKEEEETNNNNTNNDDDHYINYKIF